MMKSYIRLVARLNEGVGKFAALLNVLLIALVCFDVLVRYVFKQTSAFFYEMEWHLFSVVFLLAAGWTLLNDRHVRVDILYSRLSERKRAIADIIGTLVFLLPFCIVILATAIPYTLNAFSSGEGSPDAGGLPYRWIIKSTIVIGALLLLLQGIALMMEKFMVILNKEP
ncbi:MAG: TRAP transporter small permease subunit [Candidatus Thermochlorobacter sp.]